MKHIFTSIKNFKSLILLAVALVAMSGNTWGRSGTAYAWPNTSSTTKKSLNDGNIPCGVYVSMGSATPSNYYQYDYASQTIGGTRYFYAKAGNGYYFIGWYSNSSYSTQKSTNNPYSNGSGTGGLTLYAKFGAVTIGTVNSNSTSSTSPLSFTSAMSKTATVVFNVSNADATDDFTYSVTGEGWAFDSWSYASNKVTINVKYTATASTTQGTHNGTVKLTSKGSSNGTTSGTYSNQSATVYANVNLTPSLTANPTSLDFGMFTVGVNNKMSKTVALSFTNGVTFEKTADATIAPFSASLSSDHKTLTVYYEPTSVGTGTWSKTLTVTAKNGQATTLSASQTITLTGQAQSTTHPEYTCTIADSYFVDDAAIDLNTLWTSTSPAAKTYEIVSFTPLASAIHTGATAPTISGTSLSLGQAGELKLKLSQPTAPGFFDGNSTKTIIINKKEPNFTLSKNTLELDQTATLTFENTNGVNVSFSPEGKVSYDASTGIITAVALGETTMTITQPEKYNIFQKSSTFTINVIKKTPTLKVIMANEERTSMSAPKGSTIAVSFVTNPAAEVVVTPVNGKQYASYVNGVMTAGVAGQTATYCASVAETATYQAKSVNFSLTVTSNSNHLPISGKTYNLGTTEEFDWSHQSTTLAFSGIPDKLTFNYKYNYKSDAGKPSLMCPDYIAWMIDDSKEGRDNVYLMYIEESADGNKWDYLWSDSDPFKDQTKSVEKQLKKDTRYVRFHHSANFASTYSEVAISELKYVQTPDPANVDFGAAVINSNIITKTTKVNWCNVAPVTVTSSDSRINVSPASFGNFEKYGTQILTLTYKPSSTDETVNATITLNNGNNTYKKTISVTASTVRRQQTITWDTNLAATGFAMNVDEQYPDANLPVIATATNQGRITFTTADANKIEVIADTALLAKGIGKVKIAAHQAGDEEYQAVHDTVEFNVTALQKQSITWNQNLRGLLTTSDTIHLKARASSGMKITYISGNTNVVKIINDTVLKVVGEGKTYIIATQAGGKDANEVDWLGVSHNNYVIVRNPASQCEDVALSDGTLTLKNGEKIYNLAGIPDTLTFTAKHGTKSGSWGASLSYDPLVVEQYATINDIEDWYQVYNRVVETNETQSGKIALDPTATKIRISTGEKGTDHTIKNILVTRKMFVRSDINNVDVEVEADAIWSKNITITHSNIDVMSISSKKNILSFSAATLGEGCGGYGDDAFTVSFTPQKKSTHYYDTIVITDGKTTNKHTLEIPVHLHSNGLTQVMSDFNAPATALTTDANFTLSASTTSNLPITFVTSDTTKARIVNGNELEYVAGGTVTVYAIQAGGTKFDSVALEQTLVISKVTPVIAENERPAADNVRYNGTWANDLLTDGAARTTWHGVADTEVQGQFVWSENVDETITNVPDTYNRSVTFKPTDSGKFNEVTFTMPVNVLRAKSVIAVDNETLLARFPEQNATLDLSTLVTEQTGEGALTFDFVNSDVTTATIDEATFTATALGDYSIRATIAQTQYYTEETFDFTVSIIEGIIFDGTNAPTPTADDPVIIRTDMTIGNGVDMEVKALTIDEGYTLTIADGGKLTVGNESSLTRTEYGHIIVEAGGKLVLNGGEIKVNEFTLHAAAGDDTHAAKSGQVSNEQQIAVQGKAYFVLDIDPSGDVTEGWYDFTVPFNVDALHGVTRQDPETGEWMPLVNETDYAIMTYHEELRAQGKYGWQKYKNIMQPGVGYSITTNSTINRYRFEMVEDGTFNHTFSKSLQASEGGLPKDKGWNIVGNGTMTYVTIDEVPRHSVQMFNHTSNSYDVISATDHQFVVGSAFFVQAETNNSVLEMTSAMEADEERSLRAPKRTAEQQIEATITISQPNSYEEADRMMITADEDATNDYIIGKDLLKMGTMSQSLKPRMWSAMKPAGILCAVYAPMQQNEAVVPFKIYMPAQGTYTISAQDSHAENVYLLRNGVIVWNLSMSDYTMEDAVGLHTEYSILLVGHTTNTATGVDNLSESDENGTIFVEKMIVDGQLYILRDGILYDAQGRKVER